MEKPVTASTQQSASQQDSADLLTAKLAELATLYGQNQLGACLNLAEKCLVDYPHHPDLACYLGFSAKQLNLEDLALACALSALRHHPEHANLNRLVGKIYYESGYPNEALIYLEKAYQLNGNAAVIMNDLAFAYYELGYLDKSGPLFKTAMDTYQDKAAMVAYGINLLAMGDYTHGWPAYEKRFARSGPKDTPWQPNKPIWNGQDAITGKKVLVHWEQGFGDTLQFSRFISPLKKKHKPHIIFCCQPAMHRLFKNNSDIDMLCTDDNIPKYDYQIALGSLPYLLKINTEAKLQSPSYIQADPELTTAWSMRMNKKPDKIAIGFSWAGSNLYMHNNRRVSDLSYFLNLLPYRPLQYFSLQKEISDADREILKYADVTHLGSDFQDFADTAAAIANLDLVICVDTGVAHLAAAMGKPVWVLLRYETEWRHPRDRETSPWYPNMRLFRQTRPGDWDSVFAAVDAALQAKIAEGISSSL